MLLDSLIHESVQKVVCVYFLTKIVDRSFKYVYNLCVFGSCKFAYNNIQLVGVFGNVAKYNERLVVYFPGLVEGYTMDEHYNSNLVKFDFDFSNSLPIIWCLWKIIKP